ncbi:MAG: N-acetylmuramoyl-L-alanine amidase [Culicoidibacterales bacterium]
MKKRQNLVPESKNSIKCPYSMQAKYITVHNTANDASADNEIKYMISNNNEVSFHFAVDDIEAVQGLHTNRNGWHCGDGGSGTGNRQSIGIEICYSKSGGSKFLQAEKNAAKLVADLLKEHNLPISAVKTHKDWSGKYCPHRTLDSGWQRFLDMIKAELNPPVAPPTPIPGTTMYRVVTGSFSSKANADKRVADLKVKGFDSFIDVYTK